MDASAPPRYLVVDDSEDIRYLAARALRRRAPQARIQTARDAEEALDALADAGEGDGLVVICDLDLGAGPGGAEVLARVARSHPRARRVLFTARANDEIDRALAREHQVVPKTGDLDALARHLGMA